MITKFLLENWQLIITLIVAPVIGYFTGKKIQKSNEKQTEADALSTIQTVYDKLTKQIEKEVDNFKTEIADLKQENRDQRADLRALQKDNSNLHLEVSKLMQENNKLKQMVAELKAENEILRKRQNERRK